MTGYIYISNFDGGNFMFKKVSLLCLSMLIGVLCLSNTSNNDAEEVSYVEDGLVYDEDEIKKEDNQLLKYKEELQDYVHVVDNQIVVDYESIEKSGKFHGSIDEVRENAEVMNDLAEERPDVVTINDDASLSFNIEDEYTEQWDAWCLSCSLWGGITYKLDSDFGKLVGIAGFVYRLMYYIANGVAFYKNMLNLTDVNYVESKLQTLTVYCGGIGISDIAKSFIQDNIGAIAAAVISINLFLATYGAASLGMGWLIFKVVNLLVQRFVPTLITSCSMIYNCFKFNSPIYAKISWWTLSIKYSLNKF